MTAHLTKTDNASIADKVFLRKKATETLSSLRVLDLYAGENILWGHFDTERYYGVEIKKNKGKNLRADCKCIIESLDLSGFNVIDCDSYGVPFDVIFKLFQNKTLKNGTVVVYTAISNKLSGVSKECLKMFNLECLYQKSVTLISEKALELFYAMLEKHGVKVLYYYRVESNFKKHYGYFIVS